MFGGLEVDCARLLALAAMIAAARRSEVRAGFMMGWCAVRAGGPPGAFPFVNS